MIGNILKSTLTFLNNIFRRGYKVTNQKLNLKFNQNGEFKIVQFTDLHEYCLKNEKTIELMENILDTEHPDLVVLTGDNIDGRYCKLKKDVKRTIANIAKPMEDRKIPWAVVLGNHDNELCMVDRKNQMRMYMSYKYNLSQNFSSVIGRAGDYDLIIKNSKNDKPIFNIYMIDSGSYDTKGYGYIKKQQIDWYKRLSTSLNKRFGKIIPALMFFHIPLKQQYQVWKSGKAVGERNEKESPQAIDSGLFYALTEMRDVKGVFVGHDHINDYIGDLNGITLGYGRKTGYNSYGKKGFVQGARVIILNENNLEKFKTYKKLRV